jgi:hypothetical protein
MDDIGSLVVLYFLKDLRPEMSPTNDNRMLRLLCEGSVGG